MLTLCFCSERTTDIDTKIQTLHLDDLISLAGLKKYLVGNFGFGAEGDE